MPLTLRRVARTGPHSPEDWLVMDGKHAVGRIRNSPASASARKWEWFVNPSLPIPPWCRGDASTFEQAKEHWLAAWLKFCEIYSPADLQRAFERQQAAEEAAEAWKKSTGWKGR